MREGHAEGVTNAVTGVHTNKYFGEIAHVSRQGLVLSASRCGHMLCKPQKVKCFIHFDYCQRPLNRRWHHCVIAKIAWKKKNTPTMTHYCKFKVTRI